MVRSVKNIPIEYKINIYYQYIDDMRTAFKIYKVILSYSKYGKKKCKTYSSQSLGTLLLPHVSSPVIA